MCVGCSVHNEQVDGWWMGSVRQHLCKLLYFMSTIFLHYFKTPYILNSFKYTMSTTSGYEDLGIVKLGFGINANPLYVYASI